MVRSCFPFIRSGQNHLPRHSERRKKKRLTEEEVGRQHQGMDRPGVCQVPEGSGQQGKMEETGCKIICGAPTTLAVKGLMMMMMITARVVGAPQMILLPLQVWLCLARITLAVSVKTSNHTVNVATAKNEIGNYPLGWTTVTSLERRQRHENAKNSQKLGKLVLFCPVRVPAVQGCPSHRGTVAELDTGHF